jgi:hypothetical protein
MIRKALGIVAVCVLVLTPGTSVFAQEVGQLPLPVGEVSVGYAYMRDTTVEENFPAGWYFSAAGNLNRWFGLAGEVSGAHKSLLDDPGFKIKANLYTFMGGPRVFVQRGRIVPFAQFLAGGVHLRVKPSAPIDGITPTETQTEFAIQPGGGVTVLLTQNVGLRGAVDFRKILTKNDDDMFDDNSEVRGIVGVVFGWGAR